MKLCAFIGFGVSWVFDYVKALDYVIEEFFSHLKGF